MYILRNVLFYFSFSKNWLNFQEKLFFWGGLVSHEKHVDVLVHIFRTKHLVT